MKKVGMVDKAGKIDTKQGQASGMEFGILS